MGSLGEYEKGQQPMLDRIRQHNAEYNAQIRACANRAPLWRRVLCVIGFRDQYMRWWYRNLDQFEKVIGPMEESLNKAE
jgi:hypothetical protein